jgi:uncharacterized protein YbjT (DUF2867 family)/predicted small metal-binding protein
MKKLNCCDAGFDCPAVVRAKTEEEVLAQAAQHALDAHGVTVTAEMAAQIKTLITDEGDTVLVVGATGLVGTEVCRQLAAQNTPFRALVRIDSVPEKVAILKELGGEIVVGDLKNPASLAAACVGMGKIISTVSCALGQKEGDNIETVDHYGQLNLIHAAKLAGVKHFVFISFPDNTSNPNPLSDAKRAVEEALADSHTMTCCSLQANYFMEIWLSPALGFDFGNAKARVYGEGNNKLNWISFKDVARFAVAALDKPFAKNSVVAIGGSEALSPKEVIAIFEKAHGKTFDVEHVPESALSQQKAGSPYPLEQSFAALMLQYAEGLPMEMSDLAKNLSSPLVTVQEYAAATKG